MLLLLLQYVVAGHAVSDSNSVSALPLELAAGLYLGIWVPCLVLNKDTGFPKVRR